MQVDPRALRAEPCGLARTPLGPTMLAPLPHADRAFIDSGKLAGYALDPAHPAGKHEARLFPSVLGPTACPRLHV